MPYEQKRRKFELLQGFPRPEKMRKQLVRSFTFRLRIAPENKTILVRQRPILVSQFDRLRNGPRAGKGYSNRPLKRKPQNRVNMGNAIWNFLSTEGLPQEIVAEGVRHSFRMIFLDFQQEGRSLISPIPNCSVDVLFCGKSCFLILRLAWIILQYFCNSGVLCAQWTIVEDGICTNSFWFDRFSELWMMSLLYSGKKITTFRIDQTFGSSLKWSVHHSRDKLLAL